jgi:hypothetical protein
MGIGKRKKPRAPQLQPGRGDGPRPAVWFCPTPGAEWDAIARAGTFDALRSETQTLQLYHAQLLSPTSTPADYHHPNNASRFEELNVLRHASALAWPLAVEGPALKSWSDDPQVYIDQWKRALDRAAALGHVVDWVVFDEPLYAALVAITPAWTRAKILDHVRTVFDAVRGMGAHVILTEPYPSVAIETMQWMIEAVPWDGFHLDIDYRHAASRNNGLRTLSMDMSRVQRTCNSSGVSHGIIVWGCDESSTDTWARSARDLLAAIQDTVHRGEMIWPHRLIVQSWSANGTAPRVMPPTLPADDPHTLWGLLKDVLAAL